ncbi:MAG TPA: TolC family protein [Humidesulfovibrio sp.]|uniref:TolC family protein n=1 Tax=Humidesulfovibrio sp. TaxID=2910988 RepID=UPI002BFF8F86|nr:TolC family protein [Humidesulfovibrio sp.]HWR04850.1 TolC family protein [Humidesulfovibrio sp.]
MLRHKHRKSFVLAILPVLLTLTGAASVFAAEDAPTATARQLADIPITLKESVAHLMQTHDRIKAAEATVKTSEHMEKRARGLWYPRLNAQVDGGREDINHSDGTKSTGMNRNVETLSANQLIYDFGGTGGAIAQARSQREEAKAKLEQMRQEVSMQGVNAYLGLIRAREMLRYAIRSEDNIKRLSGMQEALVERGVGLSYEELQIKAQLAGAQAHRVNVERSMVSARNNYRSVFQFDVSDAQIESLLLPSMPQTSLPSTLDGAVEQALDANPSLVELMHSINSRQGELAQRESSMYPKIEAVAEAMRKENDQGETSVRTEGRAGLQVTYNLFQGFRDVEATRAAKSDIVSVRKTLLDRRRTVEERVRNAWNDMTTLTRTVALYDNQANITWSFLELIKKKKALGGDVNLLDILVGERDYISATSSKVTADIDLITAAYTLFYQMGQLRPEVVEN